MHSLGLMCTKMGTNVARRPCWHLCILFTLCAVNTVSVFWKDVHYNNAIQNCLYMLQKWSVIALCIPNLWVRSGKVGGWDGFLRCHLPRSARFNVVIILKPKIYRNQCWRTYCAAISSKVNNSKCGGGLIYIGVFLSTPFKILLRQKYSYLMSVT